MLGVRCDGDRASRQHRKQGGKSQGVACSSTAKYRWRLGAPSVTGTSDAFKKACGGFLASRARNLRQGHDVCCTSRGRSSGEKQITSRPTFVGNTEGGSVTETRPTFYLGTLTTRVGMPNLGSNSKRKTVSSVKVSDWSREADKNLYLRSPFTVL